MAKNPKKTSSAFEGINSKVILLSKTRCKSTIKDWEETEIEVKWQHLSHKSQKKFKRRRVPFQGKHLPLGHLFKDIPDLLNLLRGEQIFSLIYDHLKLGEKFKRNDFEYVKRNIELTRLVVNNVKNLYKPDDEHCYVIIDGEEYEEEIKPFHSQCDANSIRNIRRYGNLCFPTGHILSDEAKDQLNQLFKNTHILTKQIGENKLVWERSYQRKVDGRSFNQESVTVKENDLDHIKEKLVIVEGEPGTGKTSLIRNLAKDLKEKHPEKFIFFTHLASCQDYLEEHKISDLSDVDKFIKANNISQGNDFYDLLTSNFLKTKNKAIVLLDGYDELSLEEYKENIIRFIDILLYNNQIYKIIITTRKNTRLNEHFPTYTIIQFERDDQIKLLIENCKRLLGSEGNSEKIKLFCIKLKELLNFENNDLLSLGIPLHIKILVESFEKELCSYVNGEELTLPSSLNMLQLYRKFIRAKMNVLIRDKFGGNLKHNKQLRDQLIKGIEGKCMRVALILLFKEDLPLLSPPVTEKEEKILLSEIKRGSIRCGIISHLENDTPVFIHLTMAEFFAAMFLYLNLRSNLQFIRNNILIRNYERKEKYPVIGLFLNLLLAQKSKFLTSIILNDKNEAVRLYASGANDVDKGGRNFLQLVMNYCRKEIITSLWEQNKKLFIEKMSSLKEKTTIPFFKDNENYLWIVEFVLEYEYNPALMSWQDLDSKILKKYFSICVWEDYLHVFKALSEISKKRGRSIFSLIFDSRNNLEIILSRTTLKILNELITNHEWNHKALEGFYLSAIKHKSEQALKMLMGKETGFENEDFYVSILSEALTTDHLSIGREVLIFVLRGKYWTNMSSIGTQALLRVVLYKCNEDLCINLVKHNAQLNYYVISRFVELKKLEVLKLVFQQFDIIKNYKMLLPAVPFAIDQGYVTLDNIPPQLIYTKDDDFGGTILHISCQGFSNEKVVEVILNIHKENMERGFNQNKGFINWGDKWGNTPLHIALRKASTHVVRVLLENGADINAINRDQETPLIYLKSFKLSNPIDYDEKLKLFEERKSLLYYENQ